MPLVWKRVLVQFVRNISGEKLECYFKVQSALHRLITNKQFATRLCNTLIQEKSNYYETQEQQIEAWKIYYDAMQRSHVFEFHDDLSYMLSITDNTPHELKLPYPVVWLDVKFEVHDIKCIGLKKNAGKLDKTFANQKERQKMIDAAKTDADIYHPEYKSIENYIRWLRGIDLQEEE